MSGVASLKRDLRWLKSREKKDTVINLELFDDYQYKIYTPDYTLHYRPNPTLLKMHQDKKSVGKHVMGPFGSGKSVGCISELLIRACDMPVCVDGIKRYRVTVIRSTYPQLVTTTWKTWLDWFGKLGTVDKNQSSPISYAADFVVKDSRTGANGKLSKVHFEAMFLALLKPDAENLDKLKSQETTDYYFNELSGIDALFYGTAAARGARYPMREILPKDAKRERKIISDTNPPDEDSWLYDFFEIKKPNGYKLYKQPPGLIKANDGSWIDNPDAENMRRNGYGLEDTYYTDAVAANDDNYINVFCCGNYGSIKAGDVVYSEYNDDLHASDDIKFNPELPIYLAFDFGGTPAVAISQRTLRGHFHVLDELTTIQPGLEQFINTELKSLLEIKYGVTNYYEQVAPVTGDPAGNARADTDAVTCYDIIERCGFRVYKHYKIDSRTKEHKQVIGASSNAIDTRLGAVKNMLNTLIDGKPKFQISKNCTALRKGFNGGYVLDKKQDGNTAYFKKEPRKNFYSHIHDALQYECMREELNIGSYYMPKSRNIA
jgi:hypothetical protein